MNMLQDYINSMLKSADSNTEDSGNSKLGFCHQFCLLMRGVYYSACSLCYKTISADHQKCLLMRDCLLFKRLLLPESTVSFELST